MGISGYNYLSLLHTVDLNCERSHVKNFQYFFLLLSLTKARNIQNAIVKIFRKETNSIFQITIFLQPMS